MTDDDRESKEDDAALEQVLAGPSGRRLVRRILTRTRVLQPVFNESHAAMSFRDGERNVGLWLMKWIEKSGRARLALLAKEECDERDIREQLQRDRDREARKRDGGVGVDGSTAS